ncbi:hypothetical protein ACOSP7_019214 [Xanthoceras sorbifolium]
MLDERYHTFFRILVLQCYKIVIRYASVSMEKEREPLPVFLNYKLLNSVAPFELLAVVWWRAWFRRNKLARNEGSFPTEDLVQWCKAFLAEFQVSRFSGVKPPSVAVLRGHAWRLPDGSLYKINCDAAVCK